MAEGLVGVTTTPTPTPSRGRTSSSPRPPPPGSARGRIRAGRTSPPGSTCRIDSASGLAHLRRRARLDPGLGHAAAQLSRSASRWAPRPSGRSSSRRAAAPGREAGSHDGLTLLSVGAAELGDRRAGGFPAAVQLPRPSQRSIPDARRKRRPTTPSNFVTGAGGFLQQVIFGYTGLRLGDKGVEPAFAPVLPSHVKRLGIRNLHVRGRRYDVMVDSTGLHMVRTTGSAAPVTPRWPLGAGAPARPDSCCSRRRSRRCLPFPSAGWTTGRLPGLPDPILPRLEGQHRPDLPRAARRAGRQSLGRRRGREPRLHGARCRGPGGPARLGVGRRRRAATAARRARSSGGSPSAATRATLGWFLLGSMRVERDFQYAKAHLKPFAAPPFYVAEESLLVANLARLPAAERERQLALLGRGQRGGAPGAAPADGGRATHHGVPGPDRAAVARRPYPSLAGAERRPARGGACGWARER